MRPLAGGAVRTFWSVRVHDRHHVPAGGPVILASNHAGVLDGPIVCGVVRRPVHALVKQEMFRGAVGGALRRLGQIPVDRFAVDVAAVKACLAVLDRGDALAIYPEGRRGAADFATMKPGVAYLALCT
ncbi:MAG TPA: lysophospholipid acyltransferase family protein, partial [Actinopolymorphaceae bacterium]|nr:lysophospholipid acyltransferase family protein [Actinopolymorphaceae bacterium]